jgi:Rha family phage regulatory protein
MSKQIDIIKQQITIKDGKPFITSRQIAETFDKEHRNVLRDIETLNCSKEFRLLNFEQTVDERENPSGGAPIPSRMFNVYKDGFILLVMGYQGRAAFRLKEAYIMAFNAMTEELFSGMAVTRSAATDAVLNLCNEVARAGYYDPGFIPKMVKYRRLGLSYSEIGKLLDRPSSTIGDWLRKARAAGIDLHDRLTRPAAPRNSDRQLGLFQSLEEK